MARKRRSNAAGVDSSFVSRIIAARVAEQLTDRPDALEKLVKLGVVDEHALVEGQGLDFAEEVRRFKERISEIAQTRPSLLAELDVRPLEIMRSSGGADGGAELEQVPRIVVFSDLEGFTSFTSERGDVEASALLTDHYDAVDALVRSRGGRVIKKIGDGHMLSFTESSAAVLAALELVAAAPAPLRLRTGAHMGSVMRTGDDLLGHVVNVASRVTDLADGGDSLVTSEVRHAVGQLPHVLFGAGHSEVLPGVTEPMEVHSVSAA